MTRLNWTLIVALAALPLVTSLAWALDRTSLRAACREDARRYCSTIQPGQGRVLQCLRQKESQLTEACRAALTTSADGQTR